MAESRAAEPFPPAGWVSRPEACRLLGISSETCKRLYRDGRLSFAKHVARPDRGWCKIYPLEPLQTLRAELDAEREQAAAVRGAIPDGYIGRHESMALFNVAPTTWKRWQRAGRIPLGELINVPGVRGRVRIYPIDELLRLREELGAQGLVPPDLETRAAERARRIADAAAKKPPADMVRPREARDRFGLSKEQWKRWQKLGWVRGQRFGPVTYFKIAEIEQILADNGRMKPPYPDPERPGVWRVTIRTSGKRKREVLVDADSMPLLEGRFINWGPPDKTRPTGFVMLSDAKAPISLRRLVMGMTDPDLYVVHINGDPLDCRKSNLVIKTVAEHCQGNKKIRAVRGVPCSSPFKGVCWDKVNEKWVAQIVVNGNRRKIGRFHDELAAAQAYDEAAFAAWGEHAYLNFPKGVDAWLEEDARRGETEAIADQAEPDASVPAAKAA